MNTLAEKIVALRAKTEKALPGPWVGDMGVVMSAPFPGGVRMAADPIRVCDIRGWGALQYRDDGVAVTEATEAHIAAFNPQVTAALLAFVERMLRLNEDGDLGDMAARKKDFDRLSEVLP